MEFQNIGIFSDLQHKSEYIPIIFLAVYYFLSNSLFLLVIQKWVFLFKSSMAGYFVLLIL